MSIILGEGVRLLMFGAAVFVVFVFTEEKPERYEGLLQIGHYESGENRKLPTIACFVSKLQAHFPSPGNLPPARSRIQVCHYICRQTLKFPNN